MNQTASEYLTAEYGETQQAIQLELDWLELLHTRAEICTNCEGSNWIRLPDGSIQCGNCD